MAQLHLSVMGDKRRRGAHDVTTGLLSYITQKIIFPQYFKLEIFNEKDWGFFACLNDG